MITKTKKDQEKNVSSDSAAKNTHRNAQAQRLERCADTSALTKKQDSQGSMSQTGTVSGRSATLISQPFVACIT